MPIGSSDGGWYENRFEAMVGSGATAGLKRVPVYKNKDPEVFEGIDPGDDEMVVSPEKFTRGRELDQTEVDPSTGMGLDVSFRMPLERPTEPAGALNEESSRVVPESVAWDKMNQPFGSIESTSQMDIFRREASKPVKPLRETSQEDIDTALNIAMSFGTGTITGIKSKLFDKTKLYQAQNMELDGYKPEEIWKATGTYKGKDGRWRQEISDKGMMLKDKAFDKEITTPPPEVDIPGQPKGWGYVGVSVPKETWHIKGWSDKPLKSMDDIQKFFERDPDLPITDVIHHPKLFEAYPELKNYRVAPLPEALIEKGVKGQVSGNTIYLSPGNPEYLRSVIAHEMQHTVQRTEGFARGGMADEFLSPVVKKAVEEFKPLAKEIESEIKALSGMNDDAVNGSVNLFKRHLEEPTKETTRRVKEIRKQYPEVADKIESLAKTESLIESKIEKSHELYRRLAGEVEARNVQTRLDMTDTERFLRSPRMTEDRPSFVQQSVGQGERIELQNK